MKKTLFGHLFTLCMLIVAGGGGGGGGSGSSAVPTVTTVTGVAAAGAAIAGTVSLKDAAGHPEIVKTTTDGTYSFDTTGLSKPYLLKVAGSANGVPFTLYSMASDQGIANINPVSNLALATAAARSTALSADLASVYAAAKGSDMQDMSGRLPRAVADVQATLKNIMNQYGGVGVNPITAVYKADGTGLDRLFDNVTIALAGTTVTVTGKGSSPTALLSADVATGFVTHALAGKVLLSGSPLSGVTVTIADTATGVVFGSAVTGAAGTYSLGGLPNGSYTVTPSSSVYSFTTASLSATVANADGTVADILTFRPYSISGRVLNANGDGLVGVAVTAQRDGEVNPHSAVTDGFGGYVVSGLTNGVYTITPSHAVVFGKNGAEPVITFAPVTGSATLSPASNSTTVNFLTSAVTYTVSGTITDPATGAGLAGVQVTLRSNTGFVATDVSVTKDPITTDGSGAYVFNGVPAGGTYALLPVLATYGFVSHNNVGDFQNFSLTGSVTFNFFGSIAPTGGIDANTATK